MPPDPGPFDLPDQEPAALKARAVRGSNPADLGAHRHRRRHHHRRSGRGPKPQRGWRSLPLTNGVGADPDVEDAEPAIPWPRPANDALDALAWLIWPTDSLEGLLQAGAFRILSMHSKVVAQTADRATVHWTSPSSSPTWTNCAGSPPRPTPKRQR